MTQQYFSADEVIVLLGITKATLYSYVSRGMLRSEEVAGKTRARRYFAADVRALQQRKAQRHNPAQSAAAALHFGDPVLESAITLIADGRLYYRGLDALRLAATERFETVATLLWTGNLTGQPAAISTFLHLPLAPLSPTLQATVQNLLTAGHVAEAMQGTLLGTATTDLAAYNQTPVAVAQTGMRILNRLTDILTLLPNGLVGNRAIAENSGERATGQGNTKQAEVHARIAQRLQQVWAPDQPVLAALIDSILILCADHELNASSFTARCVASTGATPYAAVIGALAALQGHKHGGATREVSLFLREAAEQPARATQAHLQAGKHLPGFGHQLYPNGDPRGTMLLALAEEHFPTAPLLITATEVCQVAHSAMQVAPNLDFGLTVLTQSAGFPEHAPFALFALGRTAGWIGHIIEQYATDRLIRPRARYTGVQPLVQD